MRVSSSIMRMWPLIYPSLAGGWRAARRFALDKVFFMFVWLTKSAKGETEFNWGTRVLGARLRRASASRLTLGTNVVPAVCHLGRRVLLTYDSITAMRQRLRVS